MSGNYGFYMHPLTDSDPENPPELPESEEQTAFFGEATEEEQLAVRAELQRRGTPDLVLGYTAEILRVYRDVLASQGKVITES